MDIWKYCSGPGRGLVRAGVKNGYVVVLLEMTDWQYCNGYDRIPRRALVISKTA